MLRPDPSEPDGPEDAPTRPQVPSVFPLDSGKRLTDLATTLAPHLGGEVSADLALDLVLNEIVEQARLATTATGAAVALRRGDEMACRATSGTNAPDLGVSMNTRSGLSGACVQTTQAQRCDDTENDPRVDAAACRRLGVRSILVVPILQEHEVLGVFEIFSGRPRAFGLRDVQTLEALSRRIVENVRRAEEAAVAPPPKPAAKAVTVPVPELETTPAEEVQRAPLETEPPERDSFTRVLTFIVVGLALLLAWIVGRVGWEIVTHSEKPAATAPATAAAPPASAPANAQQPGPQPPPRTPVAAPAPKTSPGAEPVAPGGLVVYQDGRVIYKEAPSRPKAPGVSLPKTGPAVLSPEESAGYVLQRVEPAYPEQARQQQIQGLVTVEVLVNPEGNVIQARALNGNSQLAAAAVDAVRQWRFKPYQRDGKPAEFSTQVTLNFTLP